MCLVIMKDIFCQIWIKRVVTFMKVVQMSAHNIRFQEDITQNIKQFISSNIPCYLEIIFVKLG